MYYFDQISEIDSDREIVINDESTVIGLVIEKAKAQGYYLSASRIAAKRSDPAFQKAVNAFNNALILRNGTVGIFNDPDIIAFTQNCFPENVLGIGSGTNLASSPSTGLPSNIPPVVKIDSPLPGSTFSDGANITISASAHDPDGSIAKVEFFNGATFIGEATNTPFVAIWPKAPAGNYFLTAKATDNFGTIAVSPPVAISVGALTSAVTGKRFVLSVGINKYSVSRLSDLRGCISDSLAFLATLLRDNSNWDIKNMLWLTDRVDLSGGKATKQNIREALNNLANLARKGDLVVYYQSSHGGNDPNEPKKSFLVAYDDRYWDNELAEDLAKFENGVNLVMIIDACNSGGLFKSIRGKVIGNSITNTSQFNFPANVMSLLERISSAKVSKSRIDASFRNSLAQNIGWITASDYSQLSAEIELNGYFTRFLCRSFSHGDKNGDGDISFKEIYDYSQPRVKKRFSEQDVQIMNESLLSSIIAARKSPSDSFEPDDEREEANLLETNQLSPEHSLDPFTDEDWFKFTLSSPAYLSIETRVDKGIELIVELYDEIGSRYIWSENQQIWVYIFRYEDGNVGLFPLRKDYDFNKGTYFLRVHYFHRFEDLPAELVDRYKLKIITQ